MPKPPIKKNNWEFLNLETTKIPANIRNASDPVLVGQFLNLNKNALSEIEKEYLAHKQQSLQKISDLTATVSQQVKNKNHVVNLTQLEHEEGSGKYMLPQINLPAYQSSENGCWSCFYQMALQSRGINDLTQEDIRSYRPKPQFGDEFEHNSDQEMNKDVRNNMVDMGDLVLDLMPDTMIRSVDIDSFNKFTGGNGGNSDDQLKYNGSVVNYVKQQILRAVKDNHSPLGIMKAGHYLTIVGIDGDTVYYKDSMPNEEAGEDFNMTHEANITTLLEPALNGENADAITITWLEDIKLSKENNLIYNTTSANITVSEDGTVNNNALEDQMFHIDERRSKGTLVGVTGGIDLPDDESQFRKNTEDGFYRIEKTYLPKTVNMESLKQKAVDRPQEEEDLLRTERQQLIDKQTAYRQKIEPLKAEIADAPPMALDPRAGRYKIKNVYDSRTFHGNVDTYFEFRNLMAGSYGWNTEKDEALLNAFANIYDIYPMQPGSPHKKGVDIVMSENLSLMNEDFRAVPAKVSVLKQKLLNYYDKMKNGGQVFDPESGSYVTIRGFKDLPLKDYQQQGIQYIESYIKVLGQIEQADPDLTTDKFDADSFIDHNGKVLTEAIKADPIIKKAGQEYKRRQGMQGFIGYGQGDIRIGSGIYRRDDDRAIGQGLLFAANPYYTGSYEFAGSGAKNLKLTEKCDVMHLDSLQNALREKGYMVPVSTEGRNMMTALVNLFNSGGPTYARLYNKVIFESGQIKQVDIDYLLTGFYHMNAGNPDIPKELKDSIQCINDILTYREEMTFRKIEDAYYDQDAAGFARELLNWEKNKNRSIDKKLYPLHYSETVQMALDNLKDEFAACSMFDPRYVFYNEVKNELVNLQKSLDPNDKYGKAALDTLLALPGSKKARDPIQKSGNLIQNDLIDNIGPGFIADNWLSQSEAKQSYKTRLENLNNQTKIIPLDPEDRHDREQAARAIIWGMLQTEGAKKTVFGHTTKSARKSDRGLIRKNEDGKYNAGDLDETVTSMAEQLLDEPDLLKAAMYEAPSISKLYDTYRARLRSKMDMEVEDAKNAEQAEDKQKKNKSKKGALDPLPEGEPQTVRLGKRDFEYLKRTRDELKQLYAFNGKFQSEYMEKLYKKLRGIINTARDNDYQVPKKDIESLKNKTLVYYDKRKGTYFGPVTDKGKARLEIVEGLSHRLDKITKDPKPVKNVKKINIL